MQNQKVSKPGIEKVTFENEKRGREEVLSKAKQTQFTRPAGVSKPLVAVTSEPPKTPKIAKSYPARLSPRDLQIIEFTLDMKFVTPNDLFEKFFSVTQKLEPAKSNLWALERLGQLESAGYLKGVQSFSESTKYYLATEKGYLAVTRRVEEAKTPKPLNSIDQRIFIHDKMVLRSRLEFEKQNPEGLWISDRKLRAGMAQMFNLPSAYIPDAIYELAGGERVAFELENAIKGRGAYREKISYFAKLIDSKRDDPNMFTRVRFRCVRQDVYKTLTEEAAIYPSLFTVELWNIDIEGAGGVR